MAERDPDLEALVVWVGDGGGGLGGASVTYLEGAFDANVADEKPQGVMSAHESLPIHDNGSPHLPGSLQILQIHSPMQTMVHLEEKPPGSS